MFQWFGFNFGLVTMLGALVFPALYLVSYGFIRFDAWRLGKDIPRHKILINVFWLLSWVLFWVGLPSISLTKSAPVCNWLII